MVAMHDAIQTAIEVVRDVYEDEKISEVEPEEIEFDDENWLITVGFTRQKTMTALGGLALPTRTLKVVKVNRLTGQFAGMKIRNPGA